MDMRQLKHTKLFPRLISAIVVAGLLTGCAPAPTPTGDIAVIELEQRIASNSAPLILDVRSADEYGAGHLPTAINISHTELPSRLAELPADRATEIVVHCHSGKRAAIAQSSLEEAGFSNVRHLDGDFIGWQEAGLPLE
jgi:phage shock protein E